MRSIHGKMWQALALGWCVFSVPHLALAQATGDAGKQGGEQDTNGGQGATANGNKQQDKAGKTEKKGPVNLSQMVVSSGLDFRSHIDTPAPVLVYDQKFFAKFEPVSVGDQLRRVPGVAFVGDIGESVAPEMRGLGNGYTQILVNGRPVPGIGNDRSVAVDRIPAEIIDRIEIVRSPSADIDSQGVGGTINILLKDGATLPPGVILRTGVSRDNKTGKIRPNAAISWSGQNDAKTVFYSFTLDAQKRFNEKHAIQEVVDGDTDGFADEVAKHGDGDGLQSWSNRNKSRATSREEQGDQRDSRDLSFNGDLTWQISNQSTLRLDASYVDTRRTEQENTVTYEGDGSVGGLDLENPEYKYETTPINEKSTSLSATLDSSLSELTDISAYVGFERTRGTEVKHYFKDTPTKKDKNKGTDADDKNWLADFSVTRQLPGFATSTGMLDASFKFGVQAKNKNRDYDALEVKGLSKSSTSTTDGHFNYKEKRLDGFAMLDMTVSPKLSLTAGVRAESTRSDQHYTNRVLKGDTLKDSSTGQASSDEFMLNPSAHLQWKLTDTDQFRFSVARTVRRPSVDQLVPSVTLESPGDYDVTIGNPDLKMERALGFDLGFEHTIGRQGVVGINLFRRNISDLIGLVKTERPVTDAGQDPGDYPGGLYTFKNLGKARVSGAELDLSLPLSFMGMDNTGFFGNYTRLFSKRLNPYTDKDVTVDDQPSYVYNVGVTQDIPEWGVSFGLSYQKQGIAWQHNSVSELQNTTYDGNLEVFLEKRLGKSVVMRLTGNNLLDACSYQMESDFAGDSADELQANNRAYNVDFMELERECSSPTWSLTLRAVF